MKNETNAFVAIPAGVELPATSKGEADAMAMWLARLQYMTEADREKRSGHWISVHSDISKRILGKRTYRSRVNAMRNAGIVQVNERYSTGTAKTKSFSKSFRLANEYRMGQSQIYEMQTRPGIKKSEKLWEIDPANLGETGVYFSDHFQEFSLDESALSDHSIQDHWTVASVARWRSRHAFATRCDYRRYHSLLTQTPEDLRSHLSIQGSIDLSIVDVSACQPLLMGYLAGSGVRSLRDLSRPLLPYVTPFLPRDVAEWIDLCQQREIYRYLWQAIREQPEPVWVEIKAKSGHRITQDLRGKSEQAFKRGSLIPLFDKLESTQANPVFQVIQQDFPTIAEWVLATKKTPRQHQLTACLCQRLESHLMIDGVGSVLMQEHAGEPVQPIHDAILCRSEFASTAKSIIAKQFRQIGLSPSIKTEAA